MADEWEHEPAEARVARVVSGLIRLASSDDACRLLGVDGTLEDEVEVSFLDQPLTWLANEIASGIRLEEDESGGVSLSSLVGLVRLYRILGGGTLDEPELRQAVVDLLDQEEDE